MESIGSDHDWLSLGILRPSAGLTMADAEPHASSKVALPILSGDFGQRAEEVGGVNPAGKYWIPVEVMD